MKELIHDGMIAFDIGAHVGEYTLIAARLVGCNGTVHAFEPQAQAVEIIAYNARLNSLENVKCIVVPLGIQKVPCVFLSIADHEAALQSATTGQTT